MEDLERRQKLRDQHSLAIGRIAVAWNEYQEDLGELFGLLFSRRDWALALASWHALENDRAQRGMLAAAAKVRLKASDRALREILWVVSQTNQMISDQRNTGIHTPLMSHTDLDGTNQILPLAMFGHARARRMVGKDLLKEFEHYEKQIRQMGSFVSAIKFNLTPKGRRRGRVIWPKRPSLTPDRHAET